MISSVRTFVSALRTASRSFGGQAQSKVEAVAPLSRSGATGDQDEALRDEVPDDLRGGSNATATGDEYDEEAVRNRQPQSRYDGNRMIVDREDRLLGTILNDRA